MADRLSHLLAHFDLRAQVVHRGVLDGVAAFGAGAPVGHLHLVRRGPVRLAWARQRRMELLEPCVLFLPRPLAHRLGADRRPGADVVSATIRFGAGDENPLLRALPELLVIPLAEMRTLDATLGLLFDEARGGRCGHQAVIDRLTEVLLVQLLRFAIEQRRVDSGLIAGLADPRLARALTAMHAEPGRAWTLATLAGEAGMSRARFAAHFAAQVGMPPGGYLTRWRIGLAQSLLRRGHPVKQVALDVGYASASALGRAFGQVVGDSPTAWRDAQRS